MNDIFQRGNRTQCGEASEPFTDSFACLFGCTTRDVTESMPLCERVRIIPYCVPLPAHLDLCAYTRPTASKLCAYIRPPRAHRLNPVRIHQAPRLGAPPEVPPEGPRGATPLKVIHEAPRPGAPPEVPPEGPRGATPLKVIQLVLVVKSNLTAVTIPHSNPTQLYVFVRLLVASS